MSESTACVMLVDDEEAVRVAFGFLLECHGLTVRSYANPTTFLAAPVPPGPCCVVLDLRLPELNGLEVLERLGTRSRPLPVILVTGHGNLQAADEALRLGAFAFLEKPFDDQRFMELVFDALRREGLEAPPA